MSQKESNYFKLQEQLNKEPMIGIGDTIHCQGIAAVIAEIYYNDRFIELIPGKDDEYTIFYDIEFRDTNGILRSWKSIYDGGYAEFTSL